MSRLEEKCRDELACQELVFSDPRCPAEVSDTRPFANAVITGMWANVAFTQNETELGRKLLWNSSQAAPMAFWGVPSLFMGFLMGYCVDDESYDYETLLDQIIDQLPVEVPNALPNYLWAVARGNFVRGVRALIWDRPQDAERYFTEGNKLGFTVDDAFARQVTHEMLGYTMACGMEAAKTKISQLSSYLKAYVGRSGVNMLKGGYLVGLADHSYRAGRLTGVPGNIFKAIFSRPRYLLDRGVLSMLLKSLLGMKSGLLSTDL